MEKDPYTKQLNTPDHRGVFGVGILQLIFAFSVFLFVNPKAIFHDTVSSKTKNKEVATVKSLVGKALVQRYRTYTWTPLFKKGKIYPGDKVYSPARSRVEVQMVKKSDRFWVMSDSVVLLNRIGGVVTQGEAFVDIFAGSSMVLSGKDLFLSKKTSRVHIVKSEKRPETSYEVVAGEVSFYDVSSEEEKKLLRVSDRITVESKIFLSAKTNQFVVNPETGYANVDIYWEWDRKNILWDIDIYSSNDKNAEPSYQYKKYKHKSARINLPEGTWFVGIKGRRKYSAKYYHSRLLEVEVISPDKPKVIMRKLASVKKSLEPPFDLTVSGSSGSRYKYSWEYNIQRELVRFHLQFSCNEFHSTGLNIFALQKFAVVDSENFVGCSFRVRAKEKKYSPWSSAKNIESLHLDSEEMTPLALTEEVEVDTN